MKWSKKQQAEWDKKNRDRMTGHSVNSFEQEGYIKDPNTGEWRKPVANRKKENK